ncbi:MULTISPECIES: zinc ribbon domain-containing protein [Sporosarcina]|uniref:Zinc ribbon domain-containing protein n=1 Tax=Sporosarcina contaminans TaxID=633403 RepID=A0ABW3TYN1_9BACL
MPSYTFRCKDCGEFTLFFKTMAGNKQKTECPNCNQQSTRVFLAPNLYSLSREVSSRIEKGMEPQRMTRAELCPKQLVKKSKVNRPWQVG